MDMIQTIVGLLIRHAATTFGGALIAKGLIDAATLETTVGAATTLIGVVLSVIQKLRAAK